MLSRLAIEREVGRTTIHRASPVVVEAAPAWFVYPLGVVCRAKVPLAGETGDVAELLHSVGDSQDEGVSFLGSGGGTWLSSLFCLIDWGS